MLERLSALAIGKQAAIGTPAVTPDAWLRVTSRSKIYRDPVFADAMASIASLDGAPHVTTRFTVKGSANFECDLVTLKLVMEHMMGAAAVANIVTPTQAVWSAGTVGLGNMAVLQPLTIWSLFAGDFERVTDCQITKFNAKYDPRGLVTGTIEFMGLESAPYAAPVLVPAIPTVFFFQPHVTLARAGAAFVVDQIDLNIEVMVDYYEGANGSLNFPGFKFGGGDSPKRKLSLDMKLVQTDQVSKPVFEAAGLTAFVLSFVNGANVIRWNIPAGQYTSRDLDGAIRETKLAVIARRDAVSGNFATISYV